MKGITATNSRKEVKYDRFGKINFRLNIKERALAILYITYALFLIQTKIYAF